MLASSFTNAVANVTWALVYAIYFDYRRRSDPAFRKALIREQRRAMRMAKTEAEAEGQQRKRKIREAVDQIKSESLPQEGERDDFFLECIKQGEIVTQTGELSAIVQEAWRKFGHSMGAS